MAYSSPALYNGESDYHRGSMYTVSEIHQIIIFIKALGHTNIKKIGFHTSIALG